MNDSDDVAQTSMNPSSSEQQYREGGSNWGPTSVSTVLAVLVAFGTVLLLLVSLPETTNPILLGSAGAVSLTVTLWLVDADEDGISTFLASLFTLPVGVGFFGGIVLIAFVLGGDIFPIADISLLSVSMLIILGHVGVVLGCSLAVFGITLGIRNVATPAALSQYTTIALVTAVVPGVVSITFAGFTFVSAGAIAGPGELWSELHSLFVSVFISTDAQELNLVSLLTLLTVAAGSLRVAIEVLPLEELLADRNESRSETVLEATKVTLAAATVTFGFVAFFWLLVEDTTTQAELETVLGQTVFETIQVFTTPSWPRTVLTALTVGSILSIAGSYLLRRLARTSAARLSRRAAMLGGGGVLTVVGLVTAEPVYSGLVTETEQRLPELVADEFRDAADLLAEFYGEGTLVVMGIGALIGLTVSIVVLLRVLLFLGYLSRTTTGPSLASAGLFVATALAATVGVSNWVVLVGIVASIVVWDAGQYGATLGREVGREAQTRTPELVHASATVLVGLVGVAVTVAVLRLEATLEPTVATVALVSAAVGLLLLIEAVR